MKLVFIGDIVGKEARETFIKKISDIKNQYKPDALIVNAENAAAGYGVTKKIAVQLIEAGVDAITLGNHAWDQKEMLSYIEECPKIVRALNYPTGVPGKGYYELTLNNDKKIIIMQVMLRLFMGMSLDDPFASVKERLQSEFIGSTCNGILIDMHGEATSEKNAFGHYVDGKVTAVLGTHTHIPTADAKILQNGTAYQTDVGMSGDYNSVIGMDKENPIHGFTKGFRSEGRFTPAKGEGNLCGVYVKSNDTNGLAEKIEDFQL